MGEGRAGSTRFETDMPEQHPATASTVIAEVVEKHEDDLVDLRRDLHAHPELSWSELRTSDLTCNRVEQAGWRITRYSRTGYAADLGGDGPLVALRADIDALPVQDLTEDPCDRKSV